MRGGIDPRHCLPRVTVTRIGFEPPFASAHVGDVPPRPLDWQFLKRIHLGLNVQNPYYRRE